MIGKMICLAWVACFFVGCNRSDETDVVGEVETHEEGQTPFLPQKRNLEDDLWKDEALKNAQKSLARDELHSVVKMFLKSECKFLVDSETVVVAPEWSIESAIKRAEGARGSGTVMIHDDSAESRREVWELTLYSDGKIQSLKIGGVSLFSDGLYGGSFATDEDLARLVDMTSLKQINVHSNRITNTGLKHLQPLGDLESLGVSGDNITDEGLEYIKGLTQVEELRLGPFEVVYQEQGLPLARQPLSEFDRVDITDDGLVMLAAMTGLRRLDLRFTRVTDLGLVHLENHSKLQMLDVRNTTVTEEGASTLKAVLPQCVILR